MASCEIRLLNGNAVQLAEPVEDTERRLSDAARSGQSRLAWLTEAGSGDRVGINPAHVVSLRPLDASG